MTNRAQLDTLKMSYHPYHSQNYTPMIFKPAVMVPYYTSPPVLTTSLLWSACVVADWLSLERCEFCGDVYGGTKGRETF